MEDGVDLKLSLFAKGVEVATSTDPSIWIAAMSLVTGTQPISNAKTPAGIGEPFPAEPPKDNLVAKLAQEMGVSRDELEGAAGPSQEAPYIHLDHKYWEALRSTPGYAKTPPPVLAATFLLLWDRHAKIGEVTLKNCGDVLKTIDLTTKNASRGFKNCDWLQVRGTSIKLNPAQISKAESLAAAYCRSRSR